MKHGFITGKLDASSQIRAGLLKVKVPEHWLEHRFEPKTMFSIFIVTNGAVHLSFLEKSKTINFQSYTDNCLEPLV
jgi:hypothetical protein